MMGCRRVLLVAGAQPGLGRSLQILLEDAGPYEVELVDSAAEAAAALDRGPAVDLLLGALSWDPDASATLLAAVRLRSPSLPVLLLSASHAVARTLAPADRADVRLVHTPVDPDELLRRIQEALEA